MCFLSVFFLLGFLGVACLKDKALSFSKVSITETKGYSSFCFSVYVCCCAF